jgi:hypothetical protein
VICQVGELESCWEMLLGECDQGSKSGTVLGNVGYVDQVLEKLNHFYLKLVFNWAKNLPKNG